MDMFLYVDRDTFVHRLDPRTKLLVMFLSFALALMFMNLTILVGLLGVVLLYGGMGRVLCNLKRIRVVLIMITLFSMLIWTISAGGLHGLFYGVMVAVKTNLMIIAGMIFLSTTKIEEIAEGLVRIGLPYRGAFAFSTAIRLVPMIVATSYTIIQAQKSRGLDLDSGSFLERIRKYVPLVIPTLVSVIRGTNVFSMALESKGFGFSPTRTNLMEIKIGRRDYLMMATWFAFTAAALVLRWNATIYAGWVAIFP